MSSQAGASGSIAAASGSRFGLTEAQVWDLKSKLPVIVLFLPPALLLFTLFVILPMGEASW